MDFGELDGRPSPGVSELSRDSLVWPVSTAGLDWLPLPTLVLAADGSAIAVNGAWAAMSGISLGDSRGNGWRQAIDPVDRDALGARLCAAAAAGEPGSADWRLACGQGRRWSRWWWRPGPARGLVVCVTEVCGDRGGEPDDWRRSAQAGVTSLLSPRQFLTMVGRGLRRSRQAGGVLAVVVVDLRGLPAGDAATGSADRLLGAMIGRLTAATRTADVVARMGAGTFAVLYEGLHDQAEAELVASRLRHSLKQPIGLDGSPHSVTVATGTAVASGPGEESHALLARAEAMLDAGPQADAGPLTDGTPQVDAQISAVAAPAGRQPRGPSGIDLRIELTSAVIQRISWVALILASAASLTEGQAAERVHNAVDELDALIHDIRASVFPLLIPPSAATGS